MIAQLPVSIQGHCIITDDLGHVLLNQTNAVHAENMARVIARALSREDNCWVNRIAFGNGGTYRTRVGGNDIINYRTPNDGIQDEAAWQSSLYNETYTENVDNRVGTGPGAATPIIVLQSNEPISTDHTTSGSGCVSIDKDRISEVIITCTLTRNDVIGQISTDYDSRTNQSTQYSVDAEAPFIFDELGLYSNGAPRSATNGTQTAMLAPGVVLTDVCIDAGTYHFSISVDANDPVDIELVIGDCTYAQLAETLTTTLIPYGVEVYINNGTAPSSRQTYGHMLFVSSSTGASSLINILVQTRDDWLFSFIKGFIKLSKPVKGIDGADKDNPIVSANESERLLTHIIFSPILKTANRTLNIKYTLTVFVNRSNKLPMIDLLEPYRYNTNTSNIIYTIVIMDSDSNIIYDIAQLLDDVEDVVTFLNNTTTIGDIWSIGGTAMNSTFIASSNNFKAVLPPNYEACNYTANVITGGLVTNVLDENIQSQVNISFEIPEDVEVVIDSLTIFSNGSLPEEAHGSQTVKLTEAYITSNTGIEPGEYSFTITIDGSEQSMTIDLSSYTTVTVADLVKTLNDVLQPLGVRVVFNSQLMFESLSAGPDSAIEIAASTDTDWLFASFIQFDSIDPALAGVSTWNPNKTQYLPNTPAILLAANIPSIEKPAGKVYTVKQTLQVEK